MKKECSRNRYVHDCTTNNIFPEKKFHILNSVTIRLRSDDSEYIVSHVSAQEFLSSQKTQVTLSFFEERQSFPHYTLLYIFIFIRIYIYVPLKKTCNVYEIKFITKFVIKWLRIYVYYSCHILKASF